MRRIGKRIGEFLYVHVACLDHLDNVIEKNAIFRALEDMPSDARSGVNVAKLNTRSGRVALLMYEAFDDDAFPALAASWMQGTPGTAPTFREYAGSLNPPILHRKELLVHDDYPQRSRWVELTSVAQSLGLFDDVHTIGFRMNWERLMADKGYQLCDGALVPIGNVIEVEEGCTVASGDPGVQRHLTALARSTVSAPVQLLLRNGLLRTGTSFFDYGCGRGGDVAALRAEGIDASGWDPYFAPNNEIRAADIVNVGFVVNVVEDPGERVEVLRRAFALTQGVMSVGVMLAGTHMSGRAFGDGLLTSRGTFQKYFGQQELRDYVETVLDETPFLAGPGVAWVFKNKEWEQRFAAGRYRRKDVSERLLASRVRRLVARGHGRRPAQKLDGSGFFEAIDHPLLQRLWELSLDLGRFPDATEIEFIEEFTQTVGPLHKGLQSMVQAFGASLLEEARTARTDDLVLHFAIQQFGKAKRYKHLEPRVQRDVKAFFGNYESAQAAGMRLLEQAAKPGRLLQACRDASTNGIGFLEGEHLQLHIALVERLPILLRAFVACGVLVYGDMSQIEMVKIHAGSAKLTLMQFDDFASKPVPLMCKRIKVSVREADYDVFEYGEAYPKPPLYHKSRYLHEEMEGFVQQLAFDEALDATGVVGGTEFGPSHEQLVHRLAAQRLEVRDGALRRSGSIPDVDAPCGATFTYRQLIECGETQARLQSPNLPRQAETYNALFDLAVRLLDPIVDYFGAIRLTYGFCSPALGRHIVSGVAPALDQHASHELGPRGRRVCMRDGAACDFIVDDENMQDVADWILDNLPFDRLYFYGRDRPIHVSYAPSQGRQAFEMRSGPSGRLIPRAYASTPR